MENEILENEVTETAAENKSFLDKVKAIPKKLWIAAGAAVGVIIALIVVLSILTNTKTTPIKLMEKTENSKKAAAYLKNQANELNGFCEREYKQIQKIQKKADNYDKTLEFYDSLIEKMQDDYGKNYKIKYKVTEKEAVDKEDYREFRDELRDYGKNLLERLEDYESEDYKEMADNLGITKEQAKKMVKIQKEIAKKLKKVKITKAYELTLTQTITGSELDEPKVTEDIKITVYKINGRWVSEDALNLL
jgi:tetratricopeptide (TPR) repeat protein